MISKNIKIINEFGLHARPAAKLVHLAAKFKSTVQLTYAGETINAKKREKCTCFCGATHSRQGKARHRRTKRHMNFVEIISMV